MKHYKITVGQGYDKNGEVIKHLYPKRQAAAKYLLDEFGGYTQTSGTGGWIGPHGAVTEEVIIFDIFTDKDILPTCEYLKGLFNQESVVLETFESSIKFI